MGKPTRISIDPQDRGFDQATAGLVAKVTFDGVVVQAVITADEVEGYVKSFQVDLDGKPVVDAGGTTFRSMERREGRVVIEWRRQERDWDEARRGESRVAVGLHDDGAVEVLVYSVVRPGAVRRTVLPASMHPDRGPRLMQLVGIAAGAAAEHYCEQFRDTLDPSDVARVAVEQCRRALADEAQAAR